MSCLRNFLEDRSGTTAIEYSLIGVLISIAIFGSFSVLHGDVASLYEMTAAKLASVKGP